METAEEFATRYVLAIHADTDEIPALADEIRADRAAVSLAAKRELLAEIWALAKAQRLPSHEYGDAVHSAVSELASKYAAKAGGGA